MKEIDKNECVTIGNMLNGNDKVPLADTTNVSGIYKIVNRINGKYYVGSSKNVFEYRFKKHIYELNENVHHNDHLQKSWNKHGSSAFDFVLVEPVNPLDLNKIEQNYLDIAKQEQDKCYNLKFIAGGGGGGFSEYSREKISASNRSRVFSETTRYKMRLKKLGRPLSEAHRQKIGKASSSRRYGKASPTRIRNMKKGLLNYYKTHPSKSLDSREYTFDNIKTGESFTGKRSEFISKYRLNHSCISQIINGRVMNGGNKIRTVHKGWVLCPNIQNGWTAPT
jgi:group I intron endonuclease